MSSPLQIEYSISFSDFEGLVRLLQEMNENPTHLGDKHAASYANELKISHLSSRKKNQKSTIQIEMDSDEEFEFEQALVYHIKNKSSQNADFGKIHLTATHDALLEDPDFKAYVETTLKENNSGSIYDQAKANLQKPWLR